MEKLPLPVVPVPTRRSRRVCVCGFGEKGGPTGIGIPMREKPVSPGSPSLRLGTFWLRLILTEFAGIAEARSGLRGGRLRI